MFLLLPPRFVPRNGTNSATEGLSLSAGPNYTVDKTGVLCLEGKLEYADQIISGDSLKCMILLSDLQITSN